MSVGGSPVLLAGTPGLRSRDQQNILLSVGTREEGLGRGKEMAEAVGRWEKENGR